MPRSSESSSTTPSTLVDFHCHLDLFPDHAAAIGAAEVRGIRTLAVTTTPRAWPRNYELTSGTRYVRAALGLHPQLVGTRANELEIWEQYLPQTRYVGEVGLDAGPQYFRSLDLQKRVFTRMLQLCADHGGKVLSVHSVRASKTVLDLVETYLPAQRGRVVLHWFTGTAAEARRAVDLGCYFSINMEMLRSDRHLALINAIPLDRLLTETDGPFTKLDGRPTVPTDVKRTVETLGTARQLAIPDLQRAIHNNLRTLLSDSHS